jgi:ribosomal protein S18 acetylase RimI-like enzyme
MAGDYRVRQAESADVARVAPLFDGYRQFYGQPSEPRTAEAFLTERVTDGQSIVFLAEEENGSVLGFAQLYPGFSSVRAEPTFVLNDLFVEEQARGRGVARQLVEAVEAHARSCGVSNLSLSTARDNHPAQQLYRNIGWQQDSRFLTFTRSLED